MNAVEKLAASSWLEDACDLFSRIKIAKDHPRISQRYEAMNDALKVASAGSQPAATSEPPKVEKDSNGAVEEQKSRPLEERDQSKINSKEYTSRLLAAHNMHWMENNYSCADCSMVLSFSAASCPHCGAKVTKEFLDRAVARAVGVNKANKQKERKEMLLLALGTLLLGPFIAFFGGLLMSILCPLFVLLALIMAFQKSIPLQVRLIFLLGTILSLGACLLRWGVNLSSVLLG